MQTVKDIMITDVHTIDEDESLFDGRSMMREKNIRHLPVVSKDGKFVGLLTQRVVLQADIKIIDQYGFDKLERIEKRSTIKEVMVKDADIVNGDSSLERAGEYLLQDKHGCVIVVNGEKIEGIITAMDFVKLALNLMKKS